MAEMMTRRSLVIGAVVSSLVPAVAARAAALPVSRTDVLMARARMALERHGASVPVRDRIGLVDFSLPSRVPRMHIVDMESGRIETLLVAHGRGSDPDHSGWVERFSNVPGSAASSAGAYLTGSLYVGRHGRSRRLIGLDPGNNNAESRAIVIHGAWYVSPDMVRDHGKLGRSEGCFAVEDQQIEKVLDRLGAGRLLFADKA